MTPLGMAPPTPEMLSKKLARGFGIGPAGMSAAHQLRLSTQIPRKALVAVPYRAPKDIGSIRFLSRAARTGRSKVRLNEIEVAVLETLDGWDSVIEIPLSEAWERLQRIIRSDAIRPDRLAMAAITEPGSVRARLRSLLSDSGFPELAQTVRQADSRTVKTVVASLAFAA